LRGDGETIGRGRGGCQHVFSKKAKINCFPPFYGGGGAGVRGCGESLGGKQVSLLSGSLIIKVLLNFQRVTKKKRKEKRALRYGYGWAMVEA